jgi:oligopeptide transport system substrate-binding protein
LAVVLALALGLFACLIASVAGVIIFGWAVGRQQARLVAATPVAPVTASAITSQPSGSPVPRRGGTLRLPGSDPTTLDPALVRDVVSAGYIGEIFSGLVTLSPDLQVIPDLAERWDVSPSGTVYTFTLRNGATFHDGKQVTAQDVAYSIERACDPATGSTVAETYLGDIVGCADRLASRAGSVAGLRVLDDRRLAITIDAPKAYFLAKLTYPTSFVVDRSQVASGPEWWKAANGTGPFRLAEYTAKEKLALARHAGFYRQPAYLDGVNFDLRPITPDTQYENGELDATPVGASDLERLRDPLNPLSAELVEGPGELGLMYLGFNLRQAPFDDVHVRRAFNYAVDKERLANVLLQGGVKPADWILPTGMPGHQDTAGPYHFDPARAKAEVAASRYGQSGVPPVTLYVSGEGGEDPVAAAVADMLSQTLAVSVTLEQAPWETFQDEVDGGRYGLYTLGWSADYADPQDFLDVLFHSRSPMNRAGYANAEVDRLLEQARTESDTARRLALYDQAERLIMADAPWVPLYSGVESWLVAPYVRGFRIPPVVVPRLAAVWLDR